MNKPIRTTLIFGFLSAVCFIPLSSIPHYWHWQITYKLSILITLALYSVLLCRWSRTPLVTILFPLLLFLGVALWSHTHFGFLLLTLAVFSWIRSGICFKNVSIRALIAEILTMAGGTVFLLFWWPATSISQPLAIWLFFLVQSLYFYIIPGVAGHDRFSVSSDLFEQACRDMERLLEGSCDGR
jgi:hypothetical protein